MWTTVIVVCSVMGTHWYFLLFVAPDLYATLGFHPLTIALILGALLGGFGCWQIMVAQNHHIMLREFTDHDSLTGVLTRARFFADVQSVSLETAAVIMVDVDFFKAVNDTHGHQCGDAVLARVARRLQAGCRRDDLVGRYGGEEFVICLPKSDIDEARQLAERLRGMIEFTAVEYEDRILAVTISLGLAVGRPGDGIDDLVARADAALLAAKTRGRNRVVAEDDMVALAGRQKPGQRRVRSVSLSF